MRCAICLNYHTPRQPMEWVAIPCGHVFCEPCLETQIKSSRLLTLSCPTCRQSFTSEVRIRLFPDFEEKDIQPTQPKKPMTEGDVAEGALISGVSEGIGIETDGDDFESLIVRAENWVCHLASDEQSRETLDNIQHTLKQLRDRLVYSKRFTSLKSVHAKIEAEHETLKVQYKEIFRKYERKKQHVLEMQRKRLEMLEKIKELTETNNRWRERDLAQQDAIKELRRRAEETFPRIASMSKAAEESSKELSCHQATIDEQSTKLMKWKKKYLAAKQQLEVYKSRASGVREQSEDDSLIITDNPDEDEGETLPKFPKRHKVTSNSSSSSIHSSRALTGARASRPLSRFRSSASTISSEGSLISGLEEPWDIDLQDSDIEVIEITPKRKRVQHPNPYHNVASKGGGAKLTRN